MNIEQQEKLKQLQDKGYDSLWKNTGYVQEIGSGIIFEITQSRVDQTDYKPDADKLAKHIGEYAYSDSVFENVVLANASIDQFCVYMRYDSDDFDELLSK